MEFDKAFLADIPTEQRNPLTNHIDAVSTLDMLALINDEDAKVAAAVRAELPRIAQAVDAIADAFQKGGKLFYVGAGTSGRIGVLDASECPPTFGVPDSMVTAVIAGGIDALLRPLEGAEDDRDAGTDEIRKRGVSDNDVVVGIAASGRTPFVLGAIEAAKALGAVTVGISGVSGSPLAVATHIAITPLTGPEALTGSTRMKCGTAQKLVLNMLSTGTMIKIGKTYGNLMVDVKPTNDKLRDRAARIVDAATGAGYEASAKVLAAAGNNPKLAIVALGTGLEPEKAQALLEGCGGFVSKALAAGGKTP